MRSLLYSRTLKEAIARLNIKYMNIDISDYFFVTKTPLGYDPSFERKIEAAGRGMKKYRNALIKLAK